MMKNYLFIFLVFSLINVNHAQEAKPIKTVVNAIEDLQVFPNPAENGKIYIDTKLNLLKTIEIYDVLGKRIIITATSSRLVDISKLSPGIYILKIKEKELTATKKLVVR